MGRYLTQSEKRDLLDSIRQVTKDDILTDDDKMAIYGICLHACEREMVKENEKGDSK